MSGKDSIIGVALTKCYFCGGSSDIIINQRLNPSSARKVEAMNGMVVSMDPCSKCVDYMRKGIILIGINPEKSEPGWDDARKIPNPYRTGHFAVLTEAGFKRAIKAGPSFDFGMAKRWMFVDEESIRALGLDKLVDPADAGEDKK